MRELFAIAPPSGNGLWLALGGIVVMMLGIMIPFAWFGYSAYRTQFELTADALQIRGAMYGRRIPLTDLNLSQAHIVNLSQDHRYRLGLRTNGVGLPGYKGGWFNLQNGEKALVFYTGSAHAVYIPTRQNYSLLLSVDRPDEFLTALRSATR